MLPGNQELLQCDEVWRNLLNHYRERKALIKIENITHNYG